MTRPIVILGAGAFGTALAMVLSQNGRNTLLWGRDGPAMADTIPRRENARHLPGLPFPAGLRATANISALPQGAVVLLAVPTQSLRALLVRHRDALCPCLLVACCKGIERGTGLLPTDVIEDVIAGARTAVLTGPSFAADIAAGKPTALTLATRDPDGEGLQALLATPNLRPYLTNDQIGAQLGGALKNVMAIGAGITIGAGLGDSARSALMTRGFAEMVRFAASQGAVRDTLFGLSGFGDLVLTCTSTLSRNLRHGLAIGAGQAVDPAVTVEGVMTAHALVEMTSDAHLPVTHTVSAVLKGRLPLSEAIETLMSRPLRHERE